jgi:glutamate dehydrogenase (NADP+)
MLAARDRALDGLRVGISGKGNVATHAALKATQDGARVVTLSDTRGTLLAPDGFDAETIDWVRAQKAAGAPISDPPKASGARFVEGQSPWQQDIDIALPCATQNEIDADAARQLADGGTVLIAEGANMPLTDAARDEVRASGILHAPGKAANGGGVAVSGLEMSQNRLGRSKSAQQIDVELREIMQNIHDSAAEEGRDGAWTDYSRGANVAAFRKVADAITAMGAI